MVVLPFTYFFCFQYSVVGRSYALAPPIAFALAALYRKEQARVAAQTVLLILLAMVSVHASLLSAAMAVAFGFQYRRRQFTLSSKTRREILAGTCCYVV